MANLLGDVIALPGALKKKNFKVHFGPFFGGRVCDCNGVRELFTAFDTDGVVAPTNKIL